MSEEEQTKIVTENLGIFGKTTLTGNSKYLEILNYNADFVARQLKEREKELYREICQNAKTCFGEQSTLIRLIEEKRFIERILFDYVDYSDKRVECLDNIE